MRATLLPVVAPLHAYFPECISRYRTSGWLNGVWPLITTLSNNVDNAVHRRKALPKSCARIHIVLLRTSCLFVILVRVCARVYLHMDFDETYIYMCVCTSNTLTFYYVINVSFWRALHLIIISEVFYPVVIWDRY